MPVSRRSTTVPGPEILGAFSAARYEVLLDAGVETVRIGRSCPALDRLAGDTDWFLVTADNPGAARSDAAENERRRMDLEAGLGEAGLEKLAPTLHRDPTGAWPDESGWAVSAADPERIDALARRHGQAAVVRGGRGRPAILRVYARVPESPHIERAPA